MAEEKARLRSMAEYTTKKRGMSPGLTIQHSRNGELEPEIMNDRPTAEIGAKKGSGKGPLRMFAGRMPASMRGRELKIESDSANSGRGLSLDSPTAPGGLGDALAAFCRESSLLAFFRLGRGCRNLDRHLPGSSRLSPRCPQSPVGQQRSRSL